MNASVPTYEKKNFIKWFLKNYQLKRREGVWILNYLLTDDHLLQHVHFVEEAHYCPRAIVMSSVESQDIPFCYYKGNVVTNDAEKSFHDLRMNNEERVYIQLNFPNSPPHMNYIAVLEDNPFIPKQSELAYYDEATSTAMLENSLYAFQQQKLYDEIDAALDAGDKELFLSLSNALQQLQLNRDKKDGM